MKLIEFILLVIVIVGCAMIINTTTVLCAKKLDDNIKANHKIVLTQIQKQINAHTKYIKAMRECLEEK